MTPDIYERYIQAKIVHAYIETEYNDASFALREARVKFALIRRRYRDSLDYLERIGADFEAVQ